MSAIDVSVVVIGRNEGKRLAHCLLSVQKAHWGALSWEVIYVDSNSQDNSPKVAAFFGAKVRGLEGARPSAAAGRNIGWRSARGELILFLDGDTRLAPRFVQQAADVLRTQPDVVAVWGNRREVAPQQSIYTRVLDLDWVFAPGRTDYFGGDALVRRTALEDVGGFDDALVAGEEPELCRRLRAQGWQIEHLDIPMTTHDLAITTASAWWTRAERAGLAYAQVAARFAHTPDPLWQRESSRNRWHGASLLALPVALVVSLLWQPWLALALAAAVLGIWVRSSWRARWKCPGQWRLAAAYALHSHLQQIPILWGQCRWLLLQRRHQAPSLIEYKGTP